MLDIIDHPEKAASLSQAGREYMKYRTLEYGYEQFYRAVDNLLHDRTIVNAPIEKIYNSPPVIADVIVQNSIKADSYQRLTIPRKRLVDILKHNRNLRKSRLLRTIWNLIKGN